ncbi:MAG: O-antigen ligase family protein [Elusimicrobia bacterium]|nr:O-antigen ligase family protein [Elusimicrobiota bacterium]
MAVHSKSDKGRRSGPLKPTAEFFAHKAIIFWLPILYFLISSLFYLRTYDSAQVKITIMQMGGVALLALWLIRLTETGFSAFSKEDIVCLLPFIAYLADGIFSYIHAPYHMASTDFFIRRVFFMLAAFVVIYEFDYDSTEWLTRVLIWTAWVAIGYGFWQFIDVNFFPPGIGKGIDPFVWRGAFGTRIFSTYGNPNFFADFLVIIFPILFTQYLKTKRKSLLPLMAMLLIDLFATNTKGAWLGFAGVVFFFGVIAFTYFKERVARYKKPILGVVVFGVLGLVAYTIKDLDARIVSANFRLFTWEGTWEMVMTQPWIGTGIGSFPPVYPAFRRAPIFHIEGKHNTETDHSEDEYLEQLFDNGILGFGIFIWLIASSLFIGFKALGQLTTTLTLKDGRPPPRTYDLMGYLVAFLGMLGHNFFDVSMRFVSSGVYLGLLSGMIVNLARGHGLYELHGLREAQSPKAKAASEEQAPTVWETLSEFLIWPARIAAFGGIVYVSFLIITQFNVLQGPASALNMAGDTLQWFLSWGVLLACVGYLGWKFFRLILLAQNPLAPTIMVLCLLPLYHFWGLFEANIHHNMAIFLSKEQHWDAAIHEYYEAHRLDPNFVMSMYFLGNVFNDRFDMNKVYNPTWGDTNNVPRDDFERALAAYDEVRKQAPNYVQMHYQVGNLYFKRAQWAATHGHPEEVRKYLDLAMTRYRLYEGLDPVYGPNFLRMGQIYMMEKDYQDAADTYKDFLLAPKGQVAPSLIENEWLRKTILSYQDYFNVPGIPYPVHRHENYAEDPSCVSALTGLGDADYMLGKISEAEYAYLKAIKLDPNKKDPALAPAERGLSLVYSKAKAEGRLRRAPPPKSPSPDSLPYTGYEIIPASH